MMASATVALSEAKTALKNVFPDADDREVEEVLHRNGGRLEDAVDTMLARRKHAGGESSENAYQQRMISEVQRRAMNRTDRSSDMVGSTSRSDGIAGESDVPCDPLNGERCRQLQEDEAYALRLQQQLYREGMQASARGGSLYANDMYEGDEDGTLYGYGMDHGYENNTLDTLRNGISQVGAAIGNGLAYLYQSFAGTSDILDEEEDSEGEDLEDWEDEEVQEQVQESVVRSTAQAHPTELRKRHVDGFHGEHSSPGDSVKKKGD